MAITNEYSPPDYSWRQRESEASVENPPKYPDNNATQTKDKTTPPNISSVVTK
jgi:hypothetical protein